jgi:hypothetical protein
MALEKDPVTCTGKMSRYNIVFDFVKFENQNIYEETISFSRQKQLDGGEGDKDYKV